jgi:DNA mismatch repair protein MutS
MSFVIDKQTLNDLGVLAKPGTDSVFSLFNRTVTAGGASLLEEIFTYPLSDLTSINRRLVTIRQLMELGQSFPFQAEQFGLIEHYQQNTDERTRLRGDQDTLGRKFLRLVDTDTERKLLAKGVIAVRDLLMDTREFFHSVALNDSEWFQREKRAILQVLEGDPFRELLSSGKKELPTASRLAEYDTVFRFRQRNIIKNILRFIYELDVYIAVANVAKARKFCLPAILQEGQGAFELENAFHPLLKSPVPNSIAICQKENMIFLTGANMAGKSTFMKTLGICVFLGHVGFPVPAQAMKFPVMGGLFTTINLPDNLEMGNSHFYAEVLRVKKVAKELGVSRNLFVIFDELFRGTNVKDAYEATVAIIAAFAKKKSSMFVISTHIIEAGEVLKERCANLRCLYLPTRMSGNTPVYTYQLEEGITNDRHGMVIIRNEGILELLQHKEKINVS